MDMNLELRKLMESYQDNYINLVKEKKEAVRDEDIDAELANDAMQKQCRIMTGELFKTMKNLGILDEEEVKFGGVKALSRLGGLTYGHVR